MVPTGVYLIFGLFVDFVFCQRSPTISYISQEQIKNIGDKVNFNCTVQYSADYPVLWIKIDKDEHEQVIISTNTAVIVPDSRFSLKSQNRINDTSLETRDYNLGLHDIQETDAGSYVCQILISTDKVISASVTLDVARPPIIVDNSTRSLIVTEGQSAVLECYAIGHPAPKIIWRREKNLVLPTGGSIFRGSVLKIESVTKEHRGTYYCVADNGVGRGNRRNINLEVEFQPVVSAPRPRIGQALQYDMDLVCHVEAFPLPAISWFKDDMLLTNNQHYSVSHFATGDEVTDTTLRVITVEKKQYGEYICRAANKLGSSDAKIELFETIIPVCPPACDTAIYRSGAASFLRTSLSKIWLLPLILKYTL